MSKAPVNAIRRNLKQTTLEVEISRSSGQFVERRATGMFVTTMSGKAVGASSFKQTKGSVAKLAGSALVHTAIARESLKRIADTVTRPVTADQRDKASKLVEQARTAKASSITARFKKA